MTKGKNRIKARIWIGILLLITIGCFGCKKKEKVLNLEEGSKNVQDQEQKSLDKTTKEATQDTVMITVGDTSITYEEIFFYIHQLKDQYESGLNKEIWNYEYLEGKTFGEYAKEKIIGQITELQVICQQAQKEGITLSEDELEEVQNLALDYRNHLESAEDREKISQEIIEKVYRDNFLANKMFVITTGGVDTNISNQEAKQITIDYLLVLTNGINKDGNKIALSEEKKKEALVRAKQLQKEAKESENFYLFAEANSDIETVRVTYGEEDKPKEFGEQGLKMKTGKLSSVIEGEAGYYILYCKSDFDEEATMQKKEDIISDKQSKVFEDAYTKWSEDYKVVVGSLAWESIIF